jgi:hypothetical protein
VTLRVKILCKILQDNPHRVISTGPSAGKIMERGKQTSNGHGKPEQEQAFMIAPPPVGGEGEEFQSQYISCMEKIQTWAVKRGVSFSNRLIVDMCRCSTALKKDGN